MHSFRKKFCLGALYLIIFRSCSSLLILWPLKLCGQVVRCVPLDVGIAPHVIAFLVQIRSPMNFVLRLQEITSPETVKGLSVFEFSVLVIDFFKYFDVILRVLLQKSNDFRNFFLFFLKKIHGKILDPDLTRCHHLAKHASDKVSLNKNNP